MSPELVEDKLDGYSVRDTLSTLRKARRLALKYERHDLVGELSALLADVRTAGEELERTLKPWRRQMASALAAEKEANQDARYHEAQNVALHAALGDREAFGRLFETGFHLEVIPSEMKKPAHKRKKIRRY